MKINNLIDKGAKDNKFSKFLWIKLILPFQDVN